MENNITLRDTIAIESMKLTLTRLHTADINERDRMLESWSARYGSSVLVRDCIAKDSYALADAMLKAREL
jgi:hypothetical protein